VPCAIFLRHEVGDLTLLGNHVVGRDFAGRIAENLNGVLRAGHRSVVEHDQIGRGDAAPARAAVGRWLCPDHRMGRGSHRALGLAAYASAEGRGVPCAGKAVAIGVHAFAIFLRAAAGKEGLLCLIWRGKFSAGAGEFVLCIEA
jgi:hypothetical protein